MPANFWVAYAEKLTIVAIAFAALYFAGRKLNRTRLFAGSRRMKVIESVALSPRAALHLVRVGARYFLVGSADEVGLVAELASGDAAADELTR
ncbi:MAG TPA: flagellar biosynthetic protein FliO [Candidatus Cybelea sp.]|jgi:flagellar biogenesis protein FliO|nr:flagellar biosynthetic protein FliO [Candidatus Cybelea sp.]